MTLRLVGRGDSAHVCALIDAITQELYGLPYPEDDWSGGWVALDGDTITGMVKTFEDRVEDLWVVRDRRSQGIGARLLAHAEREIADRGHRVARLRTVASNQRTRAFYAREGWKEIRAFPHETLGTEMIELQKELSSA